MHTCNMFVCMIADLSDDRYLQHFCQPNPLRMQSVSFFSDPGQVSRKWRRKKISLINWCPGDTCHCQGHEGNFFHIKPIVGTVS